MISMAEAGWVPDGLVRLGIKRLLSKRLRIISSDSNRSDQRQLIEVLGRDAIAVETKAANEQHYEVPAEFFQVILGKRLKYSCGHFENEASTLDEAEESMLRLTCERANLQDGQDILELGCGWGSLTVWMAEHFPASRITAISNSNSQRAFIQRRLENRGLENVEILTRDVNHFESDRSFDRIVSVELFEHLRNYRELFRRIAGWLKNDGRLFVHVFCHRSSTYLFETDGADNWMGRHFFTGGTMPAMDLFSNFQEDLTIEQQWKVNGLHYWRTCEAWLSRLDSHRSALLDLFQAQMSPAQARIALQRWRMFMMACAELFRFRSGDEWFVSHYLLRHSTAD